MAHLKESTGVQTQRSYRLDNIDLMRGFVILIMGLDHVRYFIYIRDGHNPMGDESSLLLFLTRLITHLCAPVFVFLAGTSAALMSTRRTPNELAFFLFTRGVWLILIEFFVISTAHTFSPLGLEQMGDYTSVTMQVLWAIGASMVLLALFQYLGRVSCLFIGVAIVVFHNMLDGVWPQPHYTDLDQPLWVSLHTLMSYRIGNFHLFFLYPALPWAGLMLLGYGAAGIFERSREEQNTFLLKIGFACIVLFVVIRGLGFYGDPNDWTSESKSVILTIRDFINTTKYPPSLLYALMTLGTAAIMLAYSDKIKGKIRSLLILFGRVPFAFYATHFFVIHSIALLVAHFQGININDMMVPPEFFPDDYGLSLGAVYVIWLCVVALLYPLCRWVATVKANRKDWWLSYL